MSAWDPKTGLHVLPVSTGDNAKGMGTPAWDGRVRYYVGTFHSFGVYADEAWYLFFADNTILIHGLPYVVEGGVKVYDGRDALGQAGISHGCIRVSPEDAEWLTNWNPENVRIVITPPTLDNSRHIGHMSRYSRLK